MPCACLLNSLFSPCRDLPHVYFVQLNLHGLLSPLILDAPVRSWEFVESSWYVVNSVSIMTPDELTWCPSALFGGKVVLCFGFLSLEGTFVLVICFWSVHTGMCTFPSVLFLLSLFPFSGFWGSCKLGLCVYITRIHPVCFQNFVWLGFSKLLFCKQCTTWWSQW